MNIELQIAETAEQRQQAADILREAAQWMLDTGNANWGFVAAILQSMRFACFSSKITAVLCIK